MPRQAGEVLRPERVAYWYFRLNGFLQIENFVVHPGVRGGQRTDADLLGIRFRHREEFAFNHLEPMVDDKNPLLSSTFDDIVITEIKTNQPCTLNGPWTRPENENVHRVLAALGFLRHDEIYHVATCIYNDGVATIGDTRVRLVAIGRDRNLELETRYQGMLQLTWDEIIGFIWDRFACYRMQKRNVEQWDDCGYRLRNLAESDRNTFVNTVRRSMGLR